MNPETQEKQKKSPLNRKFLLRGLVICVFLMLLPFAGIQAWKQSLFYFYKGMWEQNYQGNYLIYSYWDADPLFPSFRAFSDDELWQFAQECSSNFACDVVYSQETYLPMTISFSNGPASLITHSFFNCSDLPPQDELLESLEKIEHDCQSIGFVLITNNE